MKRRLLLICDKCLFWMLFFLFVIVLVWCIFEIEFFVKSRILFWVYVLFLKKEKLKKFFYLVYNVVIYNF